VRCFEVRCSGPRDAVQVNEQRLNAIRGTLGAPEGMMDILSDYPQPKQEPQPPPVMYVCSHACMICTAYACVCACQAAAACLQHWAAKQAV
jgi:hypothetical protein